MTPPFSSPTAPGTNLQLPNLKSDDTVDSATKPRKAVGRMVPSQDWDHVALSVLFYSNPSSSPLMCFLHISFSIVMWSFVVLGLGL